tara:strand:+ start:1622 stop:2551 length:930 start_codon:yes stop_codon:yes gene_type:complete
MGLKKHSPQGADPSIKSGKSLINMRGPFQMKGSPYTMKSPLEGNAFVGAKVAAEKAGKDSFQVDGKSFPVQMKGTPVYKYASDAQRKAVHASKADGGKGAPTNNYGKIVPQMKGDPNKRMDKLSDKHKKLYDRFEMGQTSEAEEARMHRLEDRMDKVGKKIKKKAKSKSPVNQGVKIKDKITAGKEKRKAKKKTKAYIEAHAKSLKNKKIPIVPKKKLKEKESSPVNKGKEERKAKRAKRREETGGTRVGNAIRKGKKVVEKVKNSKVGKVASGIAETVSNVKKGKIAAAVKSGKQTVADAKEKKVKKS